MRLRLFFTLIFCLGGCQPTSVFLDSDRAHGVLIRTRRYNSGWFEELQMGDLKRECLEEKCTYEEAREVFEHTETTDEFWKKYNVPDFCSSSPCVNGGSCSAQDSSYTCFCLPQFGGVHCEQELQAVTSTCELENGGCEHFCDEDFQTQTVTCSCADGYFLHADGQSCVARARFTSNGCHYRNGGCEHFCREFPDRAFVCFCATGYQLATRDNSSCDPQDSVPCGRPRIHFSPRVVNGKVCPKGHCPWQAMLTENGVYTCGAIVLSDQWILTAAHCVWGKPVSILHVTVGEHDRQEEEKSEQRRRVLKLLIHAGYNKSSSDSDLALLKLQQPVKLGLHVVPICLPAANTTFVRTLASVRHSTVSGWGRLAQHGPPSRYLKRLVLPRVPIQECRLHTKLNITRNMLCAGYRAGGQGACEGDGGGPLVTRYRKTWFLTGVVSWGKGCANENLYGVYTKVSNFLGWIEEMRSTG